MNPLNRRLQEVFLFSPSDLHVNRAGRLSPRQQARQRAGGSASWLAAGVFVMVMLCSVGIIALISWQSGGFQGPARTDALISLLVIGGVASAAIVIGLALSWRYMSALFSQRIVTAHGTAAFGKVHEDSAHFELKLGATKLRLVTEEQLTAFEPGQTYRVFYRPGPVPFILSAELSGTEAENDLAAATELPATEPDIVISRTRRAVLVVLAVGALAITIPLAGVITASLPEAVRLSVMGGLCLVSLLFVPLTVWFMGRP